MSISHRKYLEFVEVHRECKQFPQVPQHTAAESRTQGLGEKEDNPASLSVSLTHSTPTSSKAQESNSEELPLVALQGRVCLPALCLGCISHECWWGLGIREWPSHSPLPGNYALCTVTVLYSLPGSHPVSHLV